LRILQVGTADSGGGAASVAAGLARAYRARGCESWLAVGQQSHRDASVFLLPDDRRPPYRLTGYVAVQSQLRRLASRFPGTGWGLVRRSLRLMTHPRALADQRRGVEDFEFPGTYSLFDLAPGRPDVLHCHNLHGGYFDLRALAWFSQQVPTVLTLHDTWLLAGHCAHSLDCDRWKSGCGRCPDLRLYPAVRRDATAENWRRKRDVYAKSRLYVAAPSQWLAGRAAESILAPAVQDIRVIPNGVDLSVFRPADKRAARAALGLPQEGSVLLLTAGSRGSMWKDQRTLTAAMAAIANRPSRAPVVFVALEDQDAMKASGGADVRAVGYQTDHGRVALYHQAADLYLHAAKADTFPSMILEALACGTPVVATAVGGIVEQIRPADLEAVRAGAIARLGRATGVLVPPADAPAMAEAAGALLDAPVSRQRLGENAVIDARERFDQERQVEAYLAWYHDIIRDWHGRSATAGARAGAPR
jgi:glycosyltransferase involved in cell wall biosynthesis